MDRITRFAPVLLCVCLWFVATFFLLGDWGWFNDDWLHVQRRPSTGAIESLVLARPTHPQFRPLYRVVAPALTTLLYEHAWVMHAIGALAHGLAGVCVWRLARMLGAGKRSALVAASGFVCAPVAFEAVLWASALSTVLSTIGTLITLTWIARVAVRTDRPLRDGWRVLLACVGTGVLAFMSASLNEGPTGMLLAGPVMVLLVPATEDQRRRRVRVLIHAAGALVGLGVYVLLHVRCVHASVEDWGQGEGPAGIATTTFGRLGELLAQVPGLVGINDVVSGMLSLGAEALGTHSVRAAVLIGCGGALAVGTGVWWKSTRPRSERLAERETMERAGRGLVLVGAVMSAGPMLAVASVHALLTPRLLYAPMVGVMLALARGLMCAGRWGCFHRAWVQQLGLGAWLVSSVLGATALVGAQQAYQLRDRADADVLAQLVRLVPTPPADTVFVPVRIDHRPVKTGSPRFDEQFRSSFIWRYSAGYRLAMAYQRDDVGAALGTEHGWILMFNMPEDPTGRVLLRAPVPRPVEHAWLMNARTPKNWTWRGRGCVLSWERVFAFEVDAQGVVRPYTHIMAARRMQSVDEMPYVEFVPPLAQGPVARGEWKQRVLGLNEPPVVEEKAETSKRRAR